MPLFEQLGNYAIEKLNQQGCHCVSALACIPTPTHRFSPCLSKFTRIVLIEVKELMGIEDAEKSCSPARDKTATFRAFPGFNGTSDMIGVQCRCSAMKKLRRLPHQNRCPFGPGRCAALR